MPVKKTIQIDSIPYTCRSIVGEDIEVGAMLGYNGSDIVNYKPGMLPVSYAKNSAKKGERVEYVIDLHPPSKQPLRSDCTWILENIVQ